MFAPFLARNVQPRGGKTLQPKGRNRGCEGFDCLRKDNNNILKVFLAHFPYFEK
jgi:hypothetical protein